MLSTNKIHYFIITVCLERDIIVIILYFIDVTIMPSIVQVFVCVFFYCDIYILPCTGMGTWTWKIKPNYVLYYFSVCSHVCTMPL